MTGKAGLGRNFNRFWVGNISSNLADGVMMTALPMVAAMLTNDPLLVSGLMVARFLPWLLIGLFAGVVVDRVDRGAVMVTVNLIRGAVLAGLAVAIATGNGSIWLLYVVMFTVMTCEVFYDLAARAMLPQLPPAGTLDRANSRLEGARTVVDGFVGAPLAGFLFAVAAAMPLAVNMGAYVLGAVVLMSLPVAVRRPKRDGHTRGEGAEGGKSSVLGEIGEGMRFLLGFRHLRNLVLFVALTNVALMAQAGVLVLLVQQHFGVPQALYGVFLTSSAAGGLLGALVVGWTVRKLGRFRTEIFCFGLLGVLCVVFALAPNAVTASLAWGVLALTSAVANIVASGIFQLVIPGSLLGRVSSCIQMIGTGMSPLGALLGGVLGRVDLRLPSLVAGAMIVLGLLLAATSIRGVSRKADIQEEKEQNQEKAESGHVVA